MERTPHIYIVGQTASGKTGLSLDACEALRKEGFEAEVLNTDSLLFYKGLDVGTAKPTKRERSEVRHHLIDVCEVGEELTASDYLKKAKEVLAVKKKNDEKKKFLCVGGSGFYVNALDVGLLPLPETDLKIKAEVELVLDPVEELEKVDLKFFDKISRNDLYRVRRALEVYRQTGKPLSQWQAEYSPKPLAKKIAFDLDRDFLRKRITKRAHLMVDEGILDEVNLLLNSGHVEWRPLFSVGYLQALKYLKGEIKTKDEMIEEMVIKTMQLSKRQKTWFKKDKSVTWFEVSDKGRDQDVAIEKARVKAKDYILKAFKEDSWKV